MKIYCATWPVKKDPIAAKTLLKMKQINVLLSYWYLTQEGEGLEHAVKNILGVKTI